MEELQNDPSGALQNWLKEKSRTMRAREWSALVDVVHDQAYSRVVGPYSNELEVGRRICRCTNRVFDPAHLTFVMRASLCSITPNIPRKSPKQSAERKMLMESYGTSELGVCVAGPTVS